MSDLDRLAEFDAGPLGAIASELQAHREILQAIQRDIERHEALLGAIAVEWQGTP